MCWMLVPDANVKKSRMLVLKTAKIVTNVSKLSPTHLVSKIDVGMAFWLCATTSISWTLSMISLGSLSDWREDHILMPLKVSVISTCFDILHQFEL